MLPEVTRAKNLETEAPGDASMSLNHCTHHETAMTSPSWQDHLFVGYSLVQSTARRPKLIVVLDVQAIRTQMNGLFWQGYVCEP